MKYAKSCSIAGRILFLNSKPFSHPEKGVLQTLISHLRWKPWWHVLISAKEMEASLPVVLHIWLLHQQCLVGTEQTQDSAYSSLPPPSILLSSHNLHIISTIPCLRDQATPLFVVSSFCQPTTSSHICQNYSTEVKAAVNRLSTSVCGPPAPTSLPASLSTAKMRIDHRTRVGAIQPTK